MTLPWNSRLPEFLPLQKGIQKGHAREKEGEDAEQDVFNGLPATFSLQIYEGLWEEVDFPDEHKLPRTSLLYSYS